MSQYSLPLALPAVFSEDNFFIAGCNHDAYRWIMAWPDWAAHAMLLYGPEGSGKSHLGHIWAERAHASIHTTLPSPDSLQGATLFEDIESITDERGLLHCFNASREQGHSLLLTANVPPQRLPFILPDLASRLLAIPVAHIGQPDDALLAAAMRKQFADRQMKVDDEVIAYLLPRMERSLSQVKAWVERLDQCALAEQRSLTVPFVRKLLEANLGLP